MYPIRILIKPAAASTTAVAASQSPGAAALTLVASAKTGPIDGSYPGANVNGVNLGLGRILTIGSGGNDSAIHFTVVGTDQNGLPITEQVTGGNVGASVTTNYYTSVQSITPSGAAASTVTVGTVNSTASAQLAIIPLDFYNRTGAIVQVDVGGTIQYTVKQTFDDCISQKANLQANVYFATPAAPTALTALSSSAYTQLLPSVCGLQVLIPLYNTGGSVLINIVQASNSNTG